jgi:hypothetical protein
MSRYPLRHHYIWNIDYIFKNVKYFHHSEYSSPMNTKSFISNATYYSQSVMIFSGFLLSTSNKITSYLDHARESYFLLLQLLFTVQSINFPFFRSSFGWSAGKMF